MRGALHRRDRGRYAGALVGDEMSAIGGFATVKRNHLKDHARPAGHPEPATALGEGGADSSAATSNGAAPNRAGVVQFRAAGRRWSVRVHWGIVFAVVASVVLWLAIKTVVELAF